MGDVARELLRRRAHHALGFARLGDYSKERLGLSASQLYDLARVSGRLASLPLTTRAFDEGTLVWAKARELVSIAHADNERAWLALAGRLTTDGLTAAVRSARADALDGAATEEQIEALAATLSLSLSEDGRTGDPSDGQPEVEDEDLIDGEAPVLFELRCPRHVRRLWADACELASRTAGEEIPRWQVAEHVAAEALSGARATGESGEGRWPLSERSSADRGEHGSLQVPPADDPGGSGTAESKLAEPETRTHEPDMAPTGDRSAEPSPAPDLDSFDAHALDTRLREAVSDMQRVDAKLGSLLRVFTTLRLYLELGYPTAESYARNRLGISGRKARGLVALARASMRTAPMLIRAYEAGDLSWLRATLLASVVTDETAAAWIERAGEVTFRRLRFEVEWARESVDGVAVAAGPPPLGAKLERQIRGHGDGSESSIADAKIRFMAPASVATLLQEAMVAWRRAGEPPWRTFERILVHVCDEWTSVPAHRDPVFERDGWRCAVPACTSRRNLHDHHIVFRSRGGDDRQDNRISVCVWHHQRGIHQGGVVRACGLAGEGIHWEVGVRASGAPLMRLLDDVYESNEAAQAGARAA